MKQRSIPYKRIILVSILLAECFCALCAPLIAPRNPYQHFPQYRFSAPFTNGYLLGSDNHGRDVLSRMIYALRSLFVTIALALLFAMGIGIALGCATIFARAPVDTFLTLCFDILLAFPLVLLALTLVASFGATIGALSFALGVVFVPVIARQVRNNGKRIKSSAFIESVITAGATRIYIIRAHILPNMKNHLAQLAAISAVLMIAISTALSFLGVSRNPPAAEFGLILRDARSYLLHAPWLMIFPGLCIVMNGVLFQMIATSWSQASTR